MASIKNQASTVYYYGMCGHLLKRQRGRSRLKNDKDRRALKFEKRYCILKKDYFAYMTTEKSAVAARQTFPVKRIKFVKNVTKGTFSDITNESTELCFQFGDEEEALYFVADDVTQKNNWMSKLNQAAKDCKNQMLETYHSGAYGSMFPGKWSCCESEEQDQEGCTSVKTDCRVERLRSISDTTVLQIPREEYLRGKSHRRRDTNESGLGDHDISPEDRFRERYSRDSSLIDIPPRAGTNESGLGVSRSKRTLNTHSLKLSSDCMLKFNGKCLLTGTRDGLVYMWNVTHDGIELISQQKTCFKVAGQIASLDTHGGYAAVGLAVVQLVKLTDTTANKRIILHKSSRLVANPNMRHLVVFIGETRKLASAQLHGNAVDIWDLSSHDQKGLITKALTCKLSESTKILSLSASSKSDSTLISVLTTNGNDVSLDIVESSTCQKVYSRILKNKPLSTPDALALTFLSNGRTMAIALDQEMLLFDYTTTGSPESHLEPWPSANHGVGLTNGDVVVYCTKYESRTWEILHHAVCEISINSGAVVSLAFIEQHHGMWCAAHKNGTLNVWKEFKGQNPKRKIHQRSAIGMELYSRGILSKPKVLQPDNNKSVDVGCGISILLPQEAMDDHVSVEAAYTPYGPGPTELLKLPPGMAVVSPILWVCANQDKHFKEPAKIELPHCFDCKTQESADQLTVLKAEHNDVLINEDGQLVISFKKIESNVYLNKQHAIIHDRHFCLYCTAYDTYSDEALQNVNYCLSILHPSTYPIRETLKTHCVLHYDLQGCHELISIQTPAGYQCTQRTNVHFHIQGNARIEAALRMQVDSAHATNDGWMVTVMAGDDISVENVNYLNYRKPVFCGESSELSEGKNLLYPHTYPPRFVLEVSPRNAQHTGVIILKFTGATSPISVTISLQQDTSQLDTMLMSIERSDRSIREEVFRYFRSLVERGRETSV